MPTENLPRLLDIKPNIAAIRQHIRAYYRGEVQEPAIARIEYIESENKLRRLQATFGRFAIFASGDLAFNYNTEHMIRLWYTSQEWQYILRSTPFMLKVN